MLRNDKGVTLVALTITVMILFILAAITANSGITAIKNARFYNDISELKVMQSKVNEMYEEYKAGHEEILENGQKIEGENEEKFTIAYDSTKQNNITDTDIGSREDYRYYTVDYVKSNLDLDGISLDFFINIKTRTVILADGTKFDGKKYYALCEIEGEQYNVEYEG